MGDLERGGFGSLDQGFGNSAVRLEFARPALPHFQLGTFSAGTQLPRHTLRPILSTFDKCSTRRLLDMKVAV